MCKYIIKHYWDDDTFDATLEPEWISSSKVLNAEEQEVKKLVNKLLSGTNYNNLSRDKPKNEIIDGFELTYTYRDKKLPHPSIERMVTDITICITKKVNYLPYIFVVGIITIFLSLAFIVLKNNDKSKSEIKIEVKQQENKSIKVDKTIAKQEKQKVIKKVTISPICRNDDINIPSPEKCYQIFIKEKCTQKSSISYDKWLSSNSPSECTYINNSSVDEDLKTFIKSLKNKKIKKNFKKFIEGK